MKLIDADKFVEYLKDARSHLSYQTYSCSQELFIRDSSILNLQQMMELQKPVDAIPTVHGKWEPIENDVCYMHVCSQCGEKIRVCIGECCGNFDKFKNGISNFCPNCGADMR